MSAAEAAQEPTVATPSVEGALVKVPPETDVSDEVPLSQRADGAPFRGSLDKFASTI